MDYFAPEPKPVPKRGTKCYFCPDPNATRFVNQDVPICEACEKLAVATREREEQRRRR